MPTSSTVQLVVEGFNGDASAVTRLIGLEPTAVGITDGKSPSSPLPGRSWIFEIAMPQTESVEGQALALLRFLGAHAEEIRHAASHYPASIAIAINGPGEPGSDEIGLVPLVAEEVSKLGLGIRIHFPYEHKNSDR